MNVKIIFGLIIILVMLIGSWFQRKREKHIWNNGICAASEKPWARFDTDSQGGRGYTDGEKHYCWISYSVDVVKN